MSKQLSISIDRSRPYYGGQNQIQVSLNVRDENGTGSGYRLAGPKYLGDSELVKEEQLSARDAAEIRALLDEVFPVEATAST